MPIRTGQQYIDSLKDGRQVWLPGQKVDVTTHPDMAAFVKVLADLYDLQRDPRFEEVLTIKSPTTGEVAEKGNGRAEAISCEETSVTEERR